MSVLKERLTRIMSGSTPKGLTGCGRLAILAVALVVLPVVPTLVQPHRKTTPPPASPPESAFQPAPPPTTPPGLVPPLGQLRPGGGGRIGEAPGPDNPSGAGRLFDPAAAPAR